jgi:endonuclease/exonuclease/phosphatase (EEP) superfamily protein YafD
VVIGILGISTLFLFPPEYLFVKQIAKYATYWMFGCLVIGIIFMFLDINWILYIAFGCAGFLALFLHLSFNTSIKFASENTDLSISVLFANPSLSTDDRNNTFRILDSIQADLVIFEELTPEWRDLMDFFVKNYPSNIMIVRIDPLGKGIFSKKPILKSDTISIFNNPVVLAHLKNSENQDFIVGICNSTPPFTLHDYNKLNSFLDTLSRALNQSPLPKILATNLNIEPWSRELREFRNETNLTSSRRQNNEGLNNKTLLSVFNAPNGEIIFSKDFECSYFNVITDSNANPIGILGKYQFIKETTTPQKY